MADSTEVKDHDQPNHHELSELISVEDFKRKVILAIVKRLMFIDC